MFSPKMFEEDIEKCSCCKKQTQLLQVIVNNTLPKNQRLVCSECEKKYQGKNKLIPYQQIVSQILQRQSEKMIMIENQIKLNLECVSIMNKNIEQLKAYILQSLDLLQENINEWTKNLKQIGTRNTLYSFYDELDKVVINSTKSSLQIEEIRFKEELSRINYRFYEKISGQLQLFIEFPEYDLCQKTLMNIIFVNQVNINKKQDEQFTISFMCKEHNQPIKYCNPLKIEKPKALCNQCEESNGQKINEFMVDWYSYRNAVRDKYCKFEKQLFEKLNKKRTSFLHLKNKISENIIYLISLLNQFAINQLKNKFELVCNCLKMEAELDIEEMIEQLNSNSMVFDYEIQNTLTDIIEVEKNRLELIQKQEKKVKKFTLIFKKINNEVKKQDLKKNVKEEESIIQNNEYPIKLRQIDGLIEQNSQCKSIAFNKQGSIMISGCYNQIIVWSFQDGKFQKQVSLKGHTYIVFCLVFSKKSNSFISGSMDSTIRCWQQQLNIKEWKSSQIYQGHSLDVSCLILNQDESLLFSGGCDNLINVWKVDLKQNQLYQYQKLSKHTNWIYAISLNISETALVSCGADEEIIIWMKNKQEKWFFQNVVKQSIQDFGCRIQFISDTQFIWINGSNKNLEKIYLYECIDQTYQESHVNNIQLNQNKQHIDDDLFPIIYNNQKQLLLIKHKFFIYLVKIEKDSKFSLAAEPIKCQSKNTYGSMTDDGKYLIFWEGKSNSYSTYEILIK